MEEQMETKKEEITIIPIDNPKHKPNIPKRIIIHKTERADEVVAKAIFEAIKIMLNPR